MPRQLVIAGALAIVATAALGAAAADPLANFYENTWNVYSATGVNHYFVNRDHTWIGIKRDSLTPAGKRPSGTWRLRDGKVCFHHVIGDPDPDDDCFAILGKKVGEPWKMDVANGAEVLGIIHEGRELLSTK